MGALVSRCYSDPSSTMLDNSMNGLDTSHSATIILNEPRGILRGVEDISSSADPMTTTVPSNSPIGGVSRSSSTLLMKEMVDRLELGQDESEGGDILTLLKSPHGARGHTHDPTTQYDDTVSPLGMGDVSTGALTPHDLTDMISNADGLPIGSPTSDMTSIKSHMAPIVVHRADSFHSNTAFPDHPGAVETETETPAAEQEMDLHIKAAAGVPQETEKDKENLPSAIANVRNQPIHHTTLAGSMSDISSLSHESGKTTTDKSGSLIIKKGKKFTFRRSLGKAASRMFRKNGSERSNNKDNTPVRSIGAKSAPV